MYQIHRRKAQMIEFIHWTSLPKNPLHGRDTGVINHEADLETRTCIVGFGA
jgi:hypothetical protein